jgi:hypothetical protein
MAEVVRIAPLVDQPGLIAYECPKCFYTTSEIVPAGPGAKGSVERSMARRRTS